MRTREEERYVGRAGAAFPLSHGVPRPAWVKVYRSWSRVRRADRPAAYVHRMLANEVVSIAIRAIDAAPGGAWSSAAAASADDEPFDVGPRPVTVDPNVEVSLQMRAAA